MDEFYQVFLSALRNGEIEVVFPKLTTTPEDLVEMQCFNAIRKIQQIIADDTLEDPECFYRIEEIVSTLEKLGLYCGGRHDFG